MIAISLVTVALSALSASSFCPPAFCVGRVTAAHAKMTVVMYIDKGNSKDPLIVKIAKLEADPLNSHFKAISDKIDCLKADIDIVKTDLKADIDNVKTDLKADINNFKTDLKADINNFKMDLKADIKMLSKDVSTLKTILVVVACLCGVPQLPTILAFFK